MGRHFRHAIAVPALAASICAGLAPAVFAADRPLVPAPELKQVPGGPPLLQGETWTDATPDYAIRVQRLDDDERLAYIHHVTGLNTDPFATPPGEVKHFETFVVQIENHGEGAVAFNPDSTWLMSDRQKDLLTPYGLGELEFDYRVVGTRFPPAYKQAGKALFEYSVFIETDQSAAGLLIFRAVPPKSRRMELQLSITLASGDNVAFKAPYRRLTKKEVEAATEALTGKDAARAQEDQE